MNISDLSILENIEEAAKIQGGGKKKGRNGSSNRELSYYQNDKVKTTFDTTNKFTTIITPPEDVKNISASAGAKGVADVGNNHAYSYTKADTLAVTDYYGNSFSSSASAALISP